MTRPVKKGEKVELKIEDLAYEGQGIAHIKKYCVFVNGGVPGQIVRAKITKAKISYAKANTEKVIKKSKTEIDPPCKYFQHCGGCTYQNLPYKEQLYFLAKQVRDTFKHLGGFEDVKFCPILSCEKIFQYRNKMEFSFSAHPCMLPQIIKDNTPNFALGLRPKKSFRKTIDMDTCLIAPAESEQVIKIVRKYAIKNRLLPFDQNAGTGFLRHLMLRKAYNTGHLMINIITHEDKLESHSNLIKELSAALSNLYSVVNTVFQNSRKRKIKKRNLLFGKEYIEEKLGNFLFRISPESFFQTNTFMAEKLYDLIKEIFDLKRGSVVWDLYCGTGSIAIYLAAFVDKVVGFEVVPEAVADARTNAKLNGIRNVKFIECNLEKYFQRNIRKSGELPLPDLIILDPPRSGINLQLIREIVKIAPREIIYVSCKPSTLVRDLKILCRKANYQIDSVHPVDMFPHTAHIEVVVKLIR